MIEPEGSKVPKNEAKHARSFMLRTSILAWHRCLLFGFQGRQEKHQTTTGLHGPEAACCAGLAAVYVDDAWVLEPPKLVPRLEKVN